MKGGLKEKLSLKSCSCKQIRRTLHPGFVETAGILEDGDLAVSISSRISAGMRPAELQGKASASKQSSLCPLFWYAPSLFLALLFYLQTARGRGATRLVLWCLSSFFRWAYGAKSKTPFDRFPHQLSLFIPHLPRE